MDLILKDRRMSTDYNHLIIIERFFFSSEVLVNLCITALPANCAVIIYIFQTKCRGHTIDPPCFLKENFEFRKVSCS
jgi:hypothetical protein